MAETDTVARAIHEDYVRKQIDAGQTFSDNPSLVPWRELPEHFKESNRRQAEAIANKLRAINCGVVYSDGNTTDFAFSSAEVEVLARQEHDRWWRERESGGWSYASSKDVDSKKSPYLVPYDELPEHIKELDRNAVRAIPHVLERAGLAVVRLQEEV